jgi:hypothetical protein
MAIWIKNQDQKINKAITTKRNKEEYDDNEHYKLWLRDP